MRRRHEDMVARIEEGIRSGSISFADLVRRMRVPIAVLSSSVALLMMFVLMACPAVWPDLTVVTIACAWLATVVSGLLATSVWYELTIRDGSGKEDRGRSVTRR